MQLVIGNKNYSSWSFRPWIAMKVAGVPFEEILIPFGQPMGNPEFKRQLAPYSPAGKVPVLVDGETRVWESLAIMEYVADVWPQATLWPADIRVRAYGRAIAHEMHAGFSALRSECPMNMRREPRRRALSDAARADIARVVDIWTESRARYGPDGPFLLGAFSAADAMYAPVVVRFHVYDVDVPSGVAEYMATMMALPAWQEWRQAALAEPWIVAEDEVD